MNLKQRLNQKLALLVLGTKPKARHLPPAVINGRPQPPIQLPNPACIPQRKQLWEYLHIGRQLHDRSPKKYFVWQRTLEPNGRDYYNGLLGDNRPIHTCPLAAILAGIDGPNAISLSLDYSATIYRLSDFYDLDFEQFMIVGVDGKKRQLGRDVMRRFDEYGWSRFHVQKMLQREVFIA